MAKVDMLCPFSGDLCRECPQYRGRHYYLCFSTRYRGHLAGGEKRAKSDNQPGASEYKFEIPGPLKPSSSWLVFADYLERTGK